MTRTFQVFTIALALAIQALALPMLAEAKGPPVRINSSDPAEGLQGQTIPMVTLFGDNFENSEPEVRYIHSLTGKAAGQKMKLSDLDWSTPGQIKYALQIEPDADVGQYDIEILYAASGRKGKGTTLFSVKAEDNTQPSECNLEFEAVFDDADNVDPDTGEWLGWLDGVRNDGPDSYYAFGGTGMRLDTNGSQSLENKNDTRFLTIDFDVIEDGCDVNDPDNPGGAAGFCEELKGADMRFEHQVQELVPNGLCLLDPDDPGNNSMRVTVGVLFKQTAGEHLLGEQPRKGTGAVRLNYGCQAQFLLQDYQKIGPAAADDYRALVTRVDQHTWRVEGTKACLHTQYGDILLDSESPDGDALYLTIPFGLTLVDPDAPPNP